MIGLLLVLYPAQWRRRYGEEFRAVLESRALGPFDVADVLVGALDARFTRFRLLERGKPRGGHNVVLRIGGLGAVAGGILWFVGLAVASALGTPDSVPWIVVAMFGMVGLLLALIGLSAFQAHREPVLAWAAFLIPALGTVVAIVGMFGMATRPSDLPWIGPLVPWAIWWIGTLGTFCGSVLFAVATVRAGVLSRRSATTLGISAIVTVLISFGPFGTDEGRLGLIAIGTSLAVFSGSWVMLGLSALRQGPIRAIQPA